jgi:hypothetical protein
MRRAAVFIGSSQRGKTNTEKPPHTQTKKTATEKWIWPPEKKKRLVRIRNGRKNMVKTSYR